MVNVTNFDLRYAVLPGKHFYQFYKSSDDFLSIMIPFFQAGLEKNEACLWLVSGRNSLDFCRATAEALIPQYSLCVSGEQFQIMSSESWYLKSESFDEGQTIGNAEKYHALIQKKGFIRLRIAGDVGFMSRKDWPQFEAYEKKIGSWLKARSVVALCAYPILECTPSQTRGILECHEDVLVGRL
ncbi:MAG: MEDS domain-containing protein [Candidatus Omnitrophica bacterium]|nr:MEDS domain-containing protein [Candidatus Omnitrophota bacterium]